MPRYFFDVADGHRLFDSSGFVCANDVAAIIRATVLAIGISLDKPEDDPERRIAIINDQGHRLIDLSGMGLQRQPKVWAWAQFPPRRVKKRSANRLSKVRRLCRRSRSYSDHL
jgi:hypothetical protein